MWSKPREIAGYNSNGYEIATLPVTGPEDALQGWKESNFHNDVILEEGMWKTGSYWKKTDWKAMGVGIDSGYAVAWFSQDGLDTRLTITAEKNTDRPGMNYKRIPLEPGKDTYDWCAYYCFTDGNCHAFTYGKPGSASNFECWLKGPRIPLPVSREGYTSGIKETTKPVTRHRAPPAP